MTAFFETLIGPPGTGKTHTLMNYVDQAFQDGIAPDKIAFISFTRKAAQEAIFRACKKFNLTKGDLPWFRTLHSLAYELMNLSNAQVMQDDNYTEFGEDIGWATFRLQYNERVERAPIGGGMGDKAFRVYSLCRATGKDARQVILDFKISGITLEQVQEFIQKYDTYKLENNKLDFTDFLNVNVDIPKLEVLIVDEAQDLTPQQWGFVKLLSKTAGRIIIAGDPDQGIYAWSGADPAAMLNDKSNMIILSQSYRVPARVKRLCDLPARYIPGCLEKNWLPRPERGTAQLALSPFDIDLTKGNWLLLCRNKQDMALFRAACYSQGVLFEGESDEFFTGPYLKLRKAILIWESLKSGGKVSYREAAILQRYIMGLCLPEKKHIYFEDTGFPPDTPWEKVFNLANGTEKAYVSRIKRVEGSITARPRIKISTIHGSKGGEADNVALMTKVSGSVFKELCELSAQEYKVWYVAASRARKNLVILTGAGKKNFSLFTTGQPQVIV